MNYRLTLITAILIVCSLCSIHSFAEVVEIKGYHYNINKEEKVATLVSYTGSSSSVVIPNSITHEDVEYSVTTFHSRLFRDSKIKNRIKKVTIGDAVTSIGDYSFQGCSSLVSVSIGNSVSSIGSCAFSGCLKLTTIIIPNSVTTIGSYAFEDCKSLSSITIGNNVKIIGNKAFNYCISLKTITLPKSLVTIGDDVFSNCDSLKSVTSLAEKAPVSDSPVNVSKIKNNILLFVPSISIDDYKGKEPWKSFGSIMSITE